MNRIHSQKLRFRIRFVPVNTGRSKRLSKSYLTETNPSFKLARAPTIAEQDAEFVTVKYDFDNRFDRPVFTGTKRILKRNRRGN